MRRTWPYTWKALARRRPSPGICKTTSGEALGKIQAPPLSFQYQRFIPAWGGSGGDQITPVTAGRFCLISQDKIAFLQHIWQFIENAALDNFTS
jgi:hypothetical protein